jgi:steroid delta-isomerase-like uncharacterized protein
MKKSLIQFITIIPLALLLCLTISCQKQDEEGITAEEAKALLDSYLEIWNKGNLALVDEIYSPDYVRRYVDIYEDIVGIDAYKQWITSTLTTMPDFHVTPEGEMIVKGDKIVSRWIAEGTNTGLLVTPFGIFPSTGKKVRFYGVFIIHVVDGRIFEEWLYFNQASLLQQLGFTITPPEPPEPPEEKK